MQPGFVYKHDLTPTMGYNEPSVLHLKFVNGQEKEYHMGMSRIDNIKNHINKLNEYIELERGMNGQDDELDDDTEK